MAMGLAAWAFLVEPARLVVDRVDLAIPHWRAEHAGLRVALLSDLHVGSPHWQLEDLKELVRKTNAEHPDLVLLAGDYVIDGVKFGTRTSPEPIAHELAELRAPLGVIAVLGNHDWWNDGVRVRHALESNGIVVLENEVRRIEKNGKSFYIVGLADAVTREQQIRPTLDAVPAGEPMIVLVHEPDVFPSIDARASITLAGHTHGGQVKLPFIGRAVVPSDYGERFAAGHVVEEGRHLFVTTGVGTSIFPVRFGVPPEIALLTLRPE
ncbi:Phosphoesterase [Labilithrix luteola]|uniref:Phosphoesterase n=1 Tax=Labilithrix luteola TaxID=1391654 RepID=A0A0K1Q0S2_9BACT|nr:Phosphoesterase [Labilithrix luteola]